MAYPYSPQTQKYSTKLEYGISIFSVDAQSQQKIREKVEKTFKFVYSSKAHFNLNTIWQWHQSNQILFSSYFISIHSTVVQFYLSLVS